MKRQCVLTILILASTVNVFAKEQGPLILRNPAVNQTQIVFSFAGDLWIVGREGGRARQLTHGAEADNPAFSPDGSEIAFYAELESYGDTYVIPVNGGAPRRLTWWGRSGLRPIAWTPDGRSILLSSMIKVPREGGFESMLPLPMGQEGSFSAEGNRIAYTPLWNRLPTWKGYRGGATSPIWIADLATLHIERIPRENSNDFAPMWVGDSIYFLSDRNGRAGLFAYDLKRKEVAQLVSDPEWDIDFASAYQDAIVYVKGGYLYLYDLSKGRSQQVEANISGDFPGCFQRDVQLEQDISSSSLSPTGDWALFETRGEILAVLTQGNHDVRNLTNSGGIRELFPVWSPDGRWVAYFSDESGEYALHVRGWDDGDQVRKIHLGDPPSFFFSPVWSPDSKKIAYGDKRLNLWCVDIESEQVVRIDSDVYQERLWARIEAPPPSWSPDSRWLAYSKLLKNWSRAVFLYSVESGRTHQITDETVDVRFPQFDASGLYLFFVSSTDSALVSGEAMSGIGHTPTRTVHLAVLRKDLPSPLPQAGFADMRWPPQESTNGRVTRVEIDLEDLEDRIVQLPVPTANYESLIAGKPGVLYMLESKAIDLSGAPVGRSPSYGPLNLHRLNLFSGKADKLGEGIRRFALSHDGEKMLYLRRDKWGVSAAANPIRPDEGMLDLGRMQVRIDPVAEWRQMFDEVWRLERDFFYDPGFHGLNLISTKQKYEPFLEGVVSREQLNQLFEMMLSELGVSHIGANGGDTGPSPEHDQVGMLGADFEIANNRYRFKRILRADPWDPRLRSPLVQPGITVRAGEYLLAVDGKELYANDNLHRVLTGKANEAVTIRVSSDPTGTDAREIRVVPVSPQKNWTLEKFSRMEENRRKVEQMTNGQVAYISLSSTSGIGYTEFDRQLGAQQDRKAVIIDLRESGGGRLADYIVQRLDPLLLGFIRTREGEDMTIPQGAITGPKVMLIDESCFSGADALAYFFRRAGLGKLVGKSTSGGLVGVGAALSLLDGGWITAPQNALYGVDGKWIAENVGVPPDIEVDQDPAAVQAGRDPQLEKAVELLLEDLEKNPSTRIPEPRYKRSRSQPGKAG